MVDRRQVASFGTCGKSDVRPPSATARPPSFFLLMDAAARRRTYDIPKSDSVGLTEWTSKIKALQRQVDEDEEAETRRLEEEIMASRISRMRRSTIQSHPLSHNPCESLAEHDGRLEIHLVSQCSTLKPPTSSQGLGHPHPRSTILNLPKTNNGIARLQCANLWANGALSHLIFLVRKPCQTTRQVLPNHGRSPRH